MPEAAAQTEAWDTQCSEVDKVTVAVIAEYREIKTKNARPRFLTKQKKKAPRKTGMQVSEVITEREKKSTRGKCIGEMRRRGWNNRLKDD